MAVLGLAPGGSTPAFISHSSRFLSLLFFVESLYATVYTRQQIGVSDSPSQKDDFG
jgi:hypothetical protein